MFDALLLTARQTGKSQGRRVLLLLSDGADTASRYTKEMAIAMVHENDFAVYAVRVEDNQQMGPFGARTIASGQMFLEDLAEGTGGHYLSVRDAKKLRTGLKEIEGELRSQYAITYQPGGKASGAFRKLRLAVSRKDVQLQHRSGYYAKF